MYVFGIDIPLVEIIFTLSIIIIVILVEVIVVLALLLLHKKDMRSSKKETSDYSKKELLNLKSKLNKAKSELKHKK